MAYLIIFIFLYFIYNLTELLIFGSLPKIDECSSEQNILPSVSIIIPARNEEKHIEKALQLIIDLDYENKEIIVINDRSEDGTGKILERMKQRYPNITVLHVVELPQGWIGKNHALHLGAQVATGDWLLFTDADIYMQKKLLTHAINIVMSKNLKHLTVTPKFTLLSPLCKIMMISLSALCFLQLKPWRAQWRSSKKAMGIGAFNLVDSKSYFSLGGHESISLNTDDDFKLGCLFKHNGYKQGVVDGREFMRLDWYDSFQEMVHGLSKNSFAIYNYSVFISLIATLVCFTLYLLPLIAIFFTNGVLLYVLLLIISVTLMLHMFVAKRISYPTWHALFYPLGIMLNIYVLWYSAFSILWNNGVTWRDTYYSLQYLKGKHLKTIF